MPYRNIEAQREYQRLWMEERRRQFFHGKTCTNCGGTETLELDHVDQNFKSTHRVWSWSKERRELELAKCQPLCRKCHREKTNEALRKPIFCGTVRGYRKGCKCAECRSSWAAHRREQRAKK